MCKFGLVGKNISYSFSKKYFTKKFIALELDNYKYCNFDIQNIKEFAEIIARGVKGLNVTIPYKEQVLDLLDEIDDDAAKIGAVNTIKIINNKLKGFNTDVYGFEESLKPLLKTHHTKALVLGTGGASKAVVFVLKKLSIDYLVVSRNPIKDQIQYKDLTKKTLKEYTIIINCTPLGTHPNVDNFPDIPYQVITDKHLLYDLIYNPIKTKFLSKGEKRGATIYNGLNMLELQAEKSWEIWNR
jgi:shikimate dehydrogenase